MIKHSPGPWYSMNTCAADIRDDTGEPVALVSVLGHQCEATGRANAVIVANAPELLAKLRAFSEAFQPSLHRNGNQTAAIIEARALLGQIDCELSA